MLTHYDDFPLHQTPEPVAHPATSDKNFYDRYFFNGFAKDGSLFFGAALGLYPHRRVMDASFSVLADAIAARPLGLTEAERAALRAHLAAQAVRDLALLKPSLLAEISKG